MQGVSTSIGAMWNFPWAPWNCPEPLFDVGKQRFGDSKIFQVGFGGAENLGSPGCCCCCCCCWCCWWCYDTFITTKLTSQPSPSQLKVPIIMRLLRWSYSIRNAVTWTVIGACKRIWTNGCADGIGESRQASSGKAEVCDDITLDT